MSRVLRVGRESQDGYTITSTTYRAQVEEAGAVEVLESLATHPDEGASAAAGRLLDRYFAEGVGEVPEVEAASAFQQWSIALGSHAALDDLPFLHFG